MAKNNGITSWHVQSFCLDPQPDVYDAVCKSTRLQNQLGDAYPIWQMGVITKWGEKLQIPTEVITQNSLKFEREMEKVMARAIVHPSATGLDKLWHAFYSTGEERFLKAAFKMAGNTRTSYDLRCTAVDMFDRCRGEFLKEAIERGVKSEAVLAFESIQVKLDQKTQELQELELQELERLKSLNIPDAQIEPDEAEFGETESGESDEADPDPKKQKFQNAMRAFDDIAAKIMSKTKL